MFVIKSPGLLVRISHLIFIQILFIFIAIALVFLYPEDKGEKSSRYAAPFIISSSTYISDIIKNDTDSIRINEETISIISKYINSSQSITSIELLFFDSSAYPDNVIVIKNLINEDPYYPDTIIKDCWPIFNYLENTRVPYLAVLSPDGNYINYMMRLENKDSDYGMVLKSPSENTGSTRSDQAELLFLLFLVSTLISLLVINMISKGIKKPLDLLIKGFADTAAGKEHIIPEDIGDRDIRRLTESFNEMSRNLADNREELSRANNELIKVNKFLLESESILTALVDYSPDGIIVTDLDDQVIIYNNTAAVELGYNENNMMGKKISNVFSLSRLDDNLSDSGHDSMEPKEIICYRRDGTRFPALLFYTPLGLDNQKKIAMLYFIKDISESQSYQEMILKLDRTASRGKMARDIAHEINNYLAILQGNLELLPILLKKSNPEKLENRINLMKDTIHNISTFTEGLTRFSDENSEFEKEDINQLIENLIAFVRPQNKFDNILLETSLSDSLPIVMVDASQIQLLLVNLISNSAEALIGEEDRKWIVISTALEEDSGYYSIKVGDSGPGIASEYLEDLFVNRFSSKEHGNGQGLLTCKNIVNNHHGEISYHSTDESKAIFYIKLPIHASEDTVTQNTASESVQSNYPINKH